MGGGRKLCLAWLAGIANHIYTCSLRTFIVRWEPEAWALQWAKWVQKQNKKKGWRAGLAPVSTILWVHHISDLASNARCRHGSLCPHWQQHAGNPPDNFSLWNSSDLKFLILDQTKEEWDELLAVATNRSTNTHGRIGFSGFWCSCCLQHPQHSTRWLNCSLLFALNFSTQCKPSHTREEGEQRFEGSSPTSLESLRGRRLLYKPLPFSNRHWCQEIARCHEGYRSELELHYQASEIMPIYLNFC